MSIQVDDTISFFVQSNKVIVNEIDDNKLSPFFCEIDIGDWQKVRSFVDAQFKMIEEN